MYILIKTSTDSIDIANSISSTILNQNLAPCTQIYKTESKYIWNKKITKSYEYIVEIKTITKYKNKVSNIIKEIHNYDIPEIISLNMNILNEDYKEWFNENI